MGCLYVIDGKADRISFNTYQEALDYMAKEVDSKSPIYFFSGKTVINNKATFNKALKDRFNKVKPSIKKSIGVTSLVQKVLSEKYTEPTTVIEHFKKHLYTNMGTLIHAYLSTYNKALNEEISVDLGDKTPFVGLPEDVKKEVNKRIQALAKAFGGTRLTDWDEISPMTFKFQSDKETYTINFVKSKTATNKDTDTTLFLSIDDNSDIINELKDFLNNRLAILNKATNTTAGLDSVFDPRNYRMVLTEVPIAVPLSFLNQDSQLVQDLKAEGIDGIRGIIDCIAVDRTGKVIVYDYKTHYGSSSIISDSNILQLELYKNILKTIFNNEIDVDDIRIIHINAPTSASSKFTASEEAPSISAIAKSKVSDIDGMFIEFVNNSKEIAEKQSKMNDVLARVFARHKTLEKQIEYERQRFENAKANYFIVQETYDPYNKDMVDASKKNDSFITLIRSNGTTYTMDKEAFFKQQVQRRNKKKQTYIDSFYNGIQSAINIGTIFNDEGNAMDGITRLQQLLSNNIHETDRQALSQNLVKYTYGQWVVEDHLGLLAQGIIPLYDRVHNVYEFIVLDYNPNFEDYKNPVKGTKGFSVLGDIFSDYELNGTTVIQATQGSILMMKAMIAINQYANTLQHAGSAVNIGKVSLLNMSNGRFFGDPNGLSDYQNTLQTLKTKKPDAEFNLLSSIELNFISDIKSDMWEFEAYDLGELTSIEGFMKAGLTPMERIAIIDAKLEQLHNSPQYRQYLSENRDTQNDINNKYVRLERLLQRVKLHLSGVYINPNKVSKRAIDRENTLGVLYNIFKNDGKIAKYSATGYTLTGVTQGYYTAIAFSNPDNAVHATNKLILDVIQKVRVKTIESNNELFQATDKFLNTYKSQAYQFFIADPDSIYKQLFKLDSNGEVNPNLILLNPYEDSMPQVNKEYLETVLWYFNRIRYEGLTPELRMCSYKEFKTLHSKQFNEYKNALKSNQTLLYYPLMKTRKINKLKSLTSREEFKKTWEKLINTWSWKINPNNLNEEELSHLDKEMKEMQMYDQFKDIDRENILNNSVLSDFEFNVERVAAEFTFSNIRKTYYDTTLKEIDCIIGYLNMYAAVTGEDVSTTIDTIRDRIKIALYSSNIAESDLAQANKIISSLRSVNSLLKIGFRLPLFVKEMSVSSLKILAKAKFGFFEGGELSLRDVIKAYGQVYSLFSSDDNQHNLFDIGNFGKVTMLNNRYGIANRDINMTVLKTIRDKYGTHNAMEQLAYLTSTAPDFFHRNAIFIACMIKDGCYDAYTAKDNQLTYDMAKDKRFKEYWNHRNEPNYSSEAFFKSKALYLAMLREFNMQGYSLHEGDKLPDAYTPTQRASILEQINTVLGAYDHELGANYQKGQFALYFMMFQTYLAGECKKLFSTRNGNTMIGRYQIVQDEQGKPLYVKSIDDITGKPVLTGEEFDENGKRRDLYMKWVSNSPEGLVISFCKTLNDIFNPKSNTKFKEKLNSTNPEDQQQIANTKVFLFNICVYALLGSLGLLIAKMIKEKKKDKNLSKNRETALMLDFLSRYQKYNERVSSEFSIWQSVITPVGGLPIVGLNVLKEFGNKAIQVVSGNDKTVGRALYEMSSSLKDTHALEMLEELGYIE